MHRSSSANIHLSRSIPLCLKRLKKPFCLMHDHHFPPPFALFQRVYVLSILVSSSSSNFSWRRPFSAVPNTARLRTCHLRQREARVTLSNRKEFLLIVR